MRAHQSLLPGFSFSGKLSFGGSQSKGNPKIARPLSTKRALHIVMRSSHAKGDASFLAHAKTIDTLLKRQAKACGMNLYELANAGNHLHLIVRIPSRRLFHKFVRASSGLIARKVLGVERGSACQAQKIPLKKDASRFWDARPFTRIVSWGKDYNDLKKYLMINRIETLGMDRMSTRLMLKEIEKERHKFRPLDAIGFS